MFQCGCCSRQSSLQQGRHVKADKAPHSDGPAVLWPCPGFALTMEAELRVAQCGWCVEHSPVLWGLCEQLQLLRRHCARSQHVPLGVPATSREQSAGAETTTGCVDCRLGCRCRGQLSDNTPAQRRPHSRARSNTLLPVCTQTANASRHTPLPARMHHSPTQSVLYSATSTRASLCCGDEQVP